MNNAIIFGTITKNPELRYTNDQTPVCSSYIEFTERTKEASPALMKTVAWGRTADTLKECVTGAQVIVEGSIRLNVVENESGIKTKVPEFNISRMQVVSLGSQSGTDTPDDDDCPFE